MTRSVKVVVVGESRSAALKVASDFNECGHDPAFVLVSTESELEASLAECELLVACHPNPTLPALRVLQLLGAKAGAPPILVYGEGPFNEDEVGDLMRAGARDCLRRGDFRRIRKAYDRETSMEAARRFHGEADPGDRYRALIEEIPALTYVAWADDVGSRAYVSPQLLTMTGYSPSDWLAEPDMWVRRLHPEDREIVLRKFRDACSLGGRFTSEYRVLDREGRVVWWRDDGRVLPGPDGGARFVRGFVLDITEQKHAEESLRRLRYYDQVTGLPNRVWLLGRLGRELASAAERGRPLALLIVALERWRETTNILGPTNGDSIVREVASRLADTVGGAESLARLRGAEFGLLVPDADATFARQLAHGILNAFNRPFMVQKLPIEVTASIGISVYPENGAEAETLLRCADVAMQVAGKVGGTAIEVYSSTIEPHNPSHLTLLNDLRHAIEGNQLQLYFQPKVDLKTHSVVGAEALLRWSHAKRGFVPPSDFIPLAENAGLNNVLTRWVLDHAVAEARAWQKAGRALDIAVNVSARSLHDGRIVEDVRGTLEKSGLDPSRLIVEVTESAVMHDRTRAADILGSITDGGVSVSIDDFGTGFTSFNLLRQLRLAELKIDRSFVDGMKNTGEDTAIVRSTSDLAHNLGLAVVAEGVEDEWTLDQLRIFGCDQAQGYHIARPMPGPAFIEWLDKSAWKTVES